MENKKLILDKENIKYMLEKTLELMPNNPQDGNITCKDVINDNTISKEKTWSSEKIEDFTLKNIETTWTEVKGVNPSVEFTKEGHMKEVEIFGNTWQDSEDLSDIRHVGELQEDGRYKIEIITKDKNFVSLEGEEVRTSKQTLLLPCQLSKVGDVSDKLYWDGEKYVIEKNILHFNLDGRTSIDKNKNNSNEFITTFNIITNGNQGKGHKAANLMCSYTKKIGIGGNEDTVTTLNQSKAIYLGISNSKLISRDEAGLLEYHKKVPFNFYMAYETPQLIETEITEQIFIPTYKDKTHFFVKGGLDGEIKGKVPVDAGKAILSLSTENGELSTLNKKAIKTNEIQDNLIDVSMLATDELYSIIEPLMENNLLNVTEEHLSKMIILYVAMVKRNLKTIEEIPEKYKEEVLSILSN